MWHLFLPFFFFFLFRPLFLVIPTFIKPRKASNSCRSGDINQEAIGPAYSPPGCVIGGACGLSPRHKTLEINVWGICDHSYCNPFHIVCDLLHLNHRSKNPHRHGRAACPWQEPVAAMPGLAAPSYTLAAVTTMAILFTSHFFSPYLCRCECCLFEIVF